MDKVPQLDSRTGEVRTKSSCLVGEVRLRPEEDQVGVVFATRLLDLLCAPGCRSLLACGDKQVNSCALSLYWLGFQSGGGTVELDLETLRDCLAVKPGRYPSFADLRRYVLVKACSDIGLVTEFWAGFRKIVGPAGKVRAVEFRFEPQEAPR